MFIWRTIFFSRKQCNYSEYSKKLCSIKGIFSEGGETEAGEKGEKVSFIKVGSIIKIKKVIQRLKKRKEGRISFLSLFGLSQERISQKRG